MGRDFNKNTATVGDLFREIGLMKKSRQPYTSTSKDRGVHPDEYTVQWEDEPRCRYCGLPLAECIYCWTCGRCSSCSFTDHQAREHGSMGGIVCSSCDLGR